MKQITDTGQSLKRGAGKDQRDKTSHLETQTYDQKLRVPVCKLAKHDGVRTQPGVYFGAPVFLKYSITG